LKDNLKFSRNWEDDTMVELKVEAQNEYVYIWQTCYVDNTFLKKQASAIANFVESSDRSLYIEFGKIVGNYTPAFSMEFSRIDSSGHIKIDLNLENEDDTDRKHRCQLYVKTEQGLLLQFGEGLDAFSEHKCNQIELNMFN